MSENQWATLIGAAGLVLAWRLARQLHGSAGVFAAVVAVNAACALRSVPGSSDTALAFAVLAVALAFAPNSWGMPGARLLTALLFGSIGATFAPGGLHRGLVGNASMNGQLIAVMLFAVIAHLRASGVATRLLIALFVSASVAVALTGASTPVGVLAVMVAAFAIANGRALYAVAAIVPIALLRLSLGPVAFDSTGRFEHWQNIFAWWISSKQYAFGLGLGSYRKIFAVMPESMGLWAHNDYLQLLFETGLVGLGSLLVVLFYALKKSYARPWLFASVAGYAAGAGFNFPAHLAPHAFVGCFLAWLAFRGR